MYSFLHSDKEAETSVAMVVDKIDVTWTELTDRYVDFLRASGFVFSDEMVKQYLADRMIEHANAEND